MNPLEVYRDTGTKAGLAQRRRDQATAQFHHEWVSRALRYEAEADRRRLRAVYDAAYRDAATPAR